ncbi:uncharacterized protein LOC142334050 isoform X2 [Lycorma delicatula]|uniref:uncharacterized protein LOC142334050 isoform X2 n=1 Tax=Lycorma delicatula TaxID=130591 RepID=UPI003F515426
MLRYTRFIAFYFLFHCTGMKCETENYVGCYVDGGFNNRLMTGYKQDFHDTNSPDVCTELCRSRGFAYAAMQYEYECFCDNLLPSFKKRAKESDCNKKCRGNKNEKCGGDWRLSVYKTGLQGVNSNEDELKYDGCFIDDKPSDRLLSGHHEDFHHALTPHYCVGLCYSLGYQYAGMQYNVQCFCGDRHLSSEAKVDDSQCSKLCSGDTSKKCGGDWRLSVYSTSFTGEKSAIENYVGCYIDGGFNNRLMNGYKENFDSTNSPNVCIKLCNSKGFAYAGMQYESECFCDNLLPSFKLRAEESDCNKLCPGNRNEKCGGDWRLSVYKTGLQEANSNHEELEYVGCFIDDNPENRFLNGHHEDFHNVLTPHFCVGLCYRLGFLYAGLQYNIQCFCGDRHPFSEVMVDDSQCSKTCPGDKSKKCGGDWRLSIYSTSISGKKSEIENYIGCYIDGGFNNRLMTGYKQNFHDTNSPNVCIKLCNSKGFAYAGMQYESECFCDNLLPSFKQRAEESDCNKPCPGNRNDKCGGDWRLSVYKTGLQEANSNHEELEYVGCFIDDNPENRFLNGHHEDFHNVLTPHFCVGLCYRLGFLYAGLQYNIQCFCGDRHPFSEVMVDDSQCSKTCPGDKSKKCGGDWRLSIYSTSISDFPADGKYIGCFIDSGENRLLTGKSVKLQKTNTPRRCLNYCLINHFLYAGLQYNFECFCGNKLPEIAAPDNDCFLECPGDSSEACGGHWRLAVYRTGYASLKDTLEFNWPEYLGCYKDEGIHSKRLMKGYKQNLNGKLTPELCIDICRSKGFHYSATQFKYECFCDNKTPSQERLTSDNECNKTCDGNPKRICGGDWRFSVYKTGLRSPADDMDNYVGCYQDMREPNRLLKTKMKLFEKHLTPQLCISLCLSHGFKLAGLQWRVECFCGDSDLSSAKTINDSECSAVCSGDSTKKCGGDLKLSIYKTGVTSKQDYELKATYIGCFNNTNKILRSYKVNLEDNSPHRCVGVCEALGYHFAGVENGVECYCGYVAPAYNLMVNSDDCSTPCPINKSWLCGNKLRIAIYSTGIAAGVTTHDKGDFLLINNEEKTCIDSNTKYNGIKACKNDVIFEESFDNLSKNRWQHTIKISDLPDEDFVIFANHEKNCFTENGKLHIKPTLLPGYTVTNGNINLLGCTGIPMTTECSLKALSYRILPPVVSAQITTKNTFYFRYGIIQIIAKLPEGDWIVPEISLEPKNQFYGPLLLSGRINIAMAVGNEKIVTENGDDISSKILESGILMGENKNIAKMQNIVYNNKGWNKEYHNFTVVWSPDDIQFIVNGEHQRSIMSEISGNKSLCSAVGLNELCDQIWDSESKIAPFDQYFYLKLGVTIGGKRIFPDKSVSNGSTKPWQNGELKEKCTELFEIEYL